MSNWAQRFFYICIISFFAIAISVIANTDVNTDVNAVTDVKLTSVKLETVDSNFELTEKYAWEKFNANDKVSLGNPFYSEMPVFIEINQSNNIVFSLTPLNSNALFFQLRIQSKPIYVFLLELERPKFINHNLHFYLKLQPAAPWYIQSYVAESSRVSGWKDGNALYKGRITYS